MYAYRKKITGCWIEFAQTKLMANKKGHPYIKEITPLRIMQNQLAYILNVEDYSTKFYMVTYALPYNKIICGI